MVKYILLLFVLVLSGCGKPYEQEIAEIVSDFNKRFNLSFNGSIEILDELEGFSPSVVGIASYRGAIKLKRSYWDNAAIECKEALLYHEIGHVYGLQHDDSVKSNGRQTTLMASTLFCHRSWFNDDLELYKNELGARVIAKLRNIIP